MPRELHQAVRRLALRPWHTALVVVILAVGTGASLTVLRLVDAILLHALPYPDAERLVRLSAHLPVAPLQEFGYSDVGYRALEQRNRSFTAVASYRTVGVNLTLGARPERVLSARVTANFFDVLGLPPVRGRDFAVHEEGAKGPPVLVLSDSYWRRAFAGDPAAIGRVVRVDGEPATIIGVADPRVAFPAANVDYYTLMDLDLVGTAPYELGIDVLARLRAGVTHEGARRDATAILQQVARENPGPHRTTASDVSGFQSIMRPLRDDIAGGVKPTLLLLSGAVLCMLVLTGVTVATLELVRANARTAEIAVRVALGADRRRLVIGAVTEGALLGGVGTVAAFAVSSICVRLLAALVPAALSSNIASPVTPAVVVGVIAVGVVAAGATAFFPVIAARRADVQSVLRARQVMRGARTIRRILIAAQVGFACMLVYAAALLVVTVRDGQRVRLGFRPEGLSTFRLNLPPESYPTPTDVARTFDRFADDIARLPGVQSVALASALPLDADRTETLIGVEGRPFRADGTDPNLDLRIVSAGYFDVMGIALIRGRVFRSGDTFADGTPAVISKRAAKLLWPDGADPIGRRVRTGPFVPWLTVIGVVDDARNRSLTEEARPEIYLPFGAPRSPVGVSREMVFVLRSATGSGPSPISLAVVERAARALNADLPVYAVRDYESIVIASQSREIAAMRILVAFALTALALAVSGSYALLMSAVVQRRRELAVRIAIGARANDLITLIGVEMFGLIAAGAVCGLTGAAVLARALAVYVTTVSSVDPRVWLGTLLVTAVGGMVAALVPAQRAARVDPMLVLRED